MVSSRGGTVEGNGDEREMQEKERRGRGVGRRRVGFLFSVFSHQPQRRLSERGGENGWVKRKEKRASEATQQKFERDEGKERELSFEQPINRVLKIAVSSCIVVPFCDSLQSQYHRIRHTIIPLSRYGRRH